MKRRFRGWKKGGRAPGGVHNIHAPLPGDMRRLIITGDAEGKCWATNAVTGERQEVTLEEITPEGVQLRTASGELLVTR